MTFTGAKVRGNLVSMAVKDLGINDCNAHAGMGATSTVAERAFSTLFKVQTTAPIAVSASAADVKSAVEALTQACTVDVTRAVDGNGHSWMVTFTANRGNASHPLLIPMSANGNLLTGGTPYLDWASSVAGNFAPGVTVTGVQQYNLATPSAGVPYYARVRARNSVGTGLWTSSSPVSLAPADQKPGAPVLARLSAVSTTQMLVEWAAPVSDGGQPVSKYRVEWDRSPLFNSADLRTTSVLASAAAPTVDVQTISTAVPPTKFLAGTFTVSYLGQKTAQLPYDVSAKAMEQALEGLCTVKDVNVERNTIQHGHSWIITFTSMHYPGSQQTVHTSKMQVLDSHRLSVDGSHLMMCDSEDTGHLNTLHDRANVCKHTAAVTLASRARITQATVAVGSVREVQSLSCEHTGTTGTITLSFAGKTMATAITIDATATTTKLAAELEKLSTVGDVTVTGGNANAICGTNPVLITFDSELGDLPLLTATFVNPVTLVKIAEVRKGRTQTTVGRLPYSALISENIGTTDWWVRVAAYSSIGYGLAQSTAPAVATPAARVSMAPRAVVVSPVASSATSLRATWTAPESDGGDTIAKYHVEWDTVDSFTSLCGNRAEQHDVSVGSDVEITGGEVFLRYTLDGGTDAGGNDNADTVVDTACFKWDAPADIVKARIVAQNVALPGAYTDPGIEVSKCVVKAGVNTFGTTWTITYNVAAATVEPLGNVVQPTLHTCPATPLQPVSVASNGLSVTTVARGTSQRPLQGQGFQGDCTAGFMEPRGSKTLVWTSPAPLTLDIDDLTPGIAYFVRVIAENGKGLSPSSAQTATSKAIPAKAPNVVTSTALTPNTKDSLRLQYSPPDAVKREGSNGAKVTSYNIELGTRVAEQQTVTVKATGGPITSGQFALSLTHNAATEVSACMAWNAAATDVERALEEFTNVDGVSVERSVLGVTAAPNGYVFTVTFDGPLLGNGDIPTLVTSTAGCAAWAPSNNGASVSSVESVKGNAGMSPEVTTVQTSGTCAFTSNECKGHIQGDFELSTDFNGDWAALGSAKATVLPASQTVEVSKIGRAHV